jgi:uncharacterized protein (DUF362 family)
VANFLAHLETLATQAHADGGWGYAPNQTAHLEPTCLALLALNLEPERFKSQIAQAEALIDRCALPDGGYREPNSRDESLWPTALVLFVKAVRGHDKAILQRMAGRLLAIQGRNANDNQAKEVHDIDLTLTGWPWAENNFSWVEPTAWACLSLRRLGLGGHTRVEQGLELLLDRTFDDGGVNYGNRQVLGKKTDPIPGPTAIALMALQGRPTNPRLDASVNYLLNQARETNDLEHLCWAKLALDCHRERAGLDESLRDLEARVAGAYKSRQSTNWVQSSSPSREALTALALAPADRNPFRLSTKQTASTEPVVLPMTAAAPRKKWSERLGAKFRGLAMEAVGRLRQPPQRSGVHIARAADYNADLAGVLRRQFTAFRDKVPLAGKRVVLKPNLVEYHRDKVINTNPHVVAAAIELCKSEGVAEIIVAEGPGHWRNAEYLVSASGLGDVLRHYAVPFVDLNHDDPVKSPNFGRLTGLDYLYLSKTIATAEVVISLPKLKTHHWAGATLSLKNLFGTLPGICYGWPKNELHWRGIDNSIVDIALTRVPDLAIVDGIIGMEGDGPLNGVPKPFGALIMGNDLVAVDATCCRLMQLDPERIKYMILAYQRKLGLLRTTEIDQLGEKIEDLAMPFETLPAFAELRLARSA